MEAAGGVGSPLQGSLKLGILKRSNRKAPPVFRGTSCLQEMHCNRSVSRFQTLGEPVEGCAALPMPPAALTVKSK